MQWLGGRNAVNQIGSAVLLKCFQYLGYFPTSSREIPFSVIEYISEQLGFPANLYDNTIGQVVARAMTGGQFGTYWDFVK